MIAARSNLNAYNGMICDRHWKRPKANPSIDAHTCGHRLPVAAQQALQGMKHMTIVVVEARSDILLCGAISWKANSLPGKELENVVMFQSMHGPHLQHANVSTQGVAEIQHLAWDKVATPPAALWVSGFFPHF